MHLLKGTCLACTNHGCHLFGAPSRVAADLSYVTIEKRPPRGVCSRSDCANIHTSRLQKTPRCSALDSSQGSTFKDKAVNLASEDRKVDFIKGGGSEIKFVQRQALKELKQPHIKDQVLRSGLMCSPIFLVRFVDAMMKYSTYLDRF